MRETYWWSGTANHMWRYYFHAQNNGVNNTKSSRKIYDICNAAFARFSERDQAIIQAYYTCKRSDAVYAAEDFSARTGIPISSIYNTIRRAGFAIMDELGLTDPERRNTP